MKKLLTLLLLLFSIIGKGQVKKYLSGKPFKTEKDTVFAPAYEVGIMQDLSDVQVIRKTWPENGRTRVMLFNAATGRPIQSAWYKDKNFKELDGIFESFHENGIQKDSGRYEKNQKQGTFKGWYEDGELHHIYHYLNGMVVDTGYVLRKDGNLSEITIADKDGNGIFQDYHTNGKIRLIGRIKKGKREGPFVFKADDGSKIMDLVYQKDSVIEAKCFNTDGVTPLGGECVFERVPEFPGGVTGWTNFLSYNLKYPENAINRNIQGVVRVLFLVYKDGRIEDIKIISSPDETLSEEVLRLMKESPRWKPGMHFHEPVIYRHLQAITFKLE